PPYNPESSRQLARNHAFEEDLDSTCRQKYLNVSFDVPQPGHINKHALYETRSVNTFRDLRLVFSRHNEMKQSLSYARTYEATYMQKEEHKERGNYILAIT
ncbi:unnamed protein product, partial [Ectocarpus sp. 12 AP-2014]